MSRNRNSLPRIQPKVAARPLRHEDAQQQSVHPGAVRGTGLETSMFAGWNPMLHGTFSSWRNGSCDGIMLEGSIGCPIPGSRSNATQSYAGLSPHDNACVMTLKVRGNQSL